MPAANQNDSTKGLHEFSMELCRNDLDAVAFCDLWMLYCHAIDDFIDTMEDGRPTLSPERFFAMLINQTMLYNSAFYLRHQAFLMPIVLSVTNAYADSVAWERSSVTRRRTIADVLRCCGNEMFFMVAMLCGGWHHMRSISGRIRERSWCLQHDANDQPN